MNKGEQTLLNMFTEHVDIHIQTGTLKKLMQMLLKIVYGTHVCIYVFQQFLLFILAENPINFFFQKYIFFPCSFKIIAHFHTRKASGGRTTFGWIMHCKTIFSADRRQRRLLYSPVSDLVNLCMWEWTQSEGKESPLWGTDSVNANLLYNSIMNHINSSYGNDINF